MNLFKNPLVIAETVSGSLLDQRSVVLYEQDSLESARAQIEAEKAQVNKGLYEFTEDWSEGIRSWTRRSLQPTIEDLVKKRKLKELFSGIEMPDLEQPLVSLTNFNLWGITYSDAEINISSSLCEHPIETGQIVMDSSIRNPIKAKVNVYVPTMFYTTIYNEILRFFEEKKKIILLTKFGLYENLVLVAMPYKLQNSTIDRPAIELSLQEVREVEPEIQYIEASAVEPIEECESGVYDNTSTRNNGFQWAEVMDKIAKEKSGV